MLPIGLEKMTRIIGTVVHSRKAYVCVMQLHGNASPDQIRSVVDEFTGSIYQRPPVRSHVKRALRVRTIYRIDLLEVKDRYALMYVESDAGTYMRKLCWDMGLRLGIGAHMKELRRVRSGPFTEDKNLVRLHELSEAVYRWKVEGKDDLLRQAVLPGEFAVCEMPKVVLRDTAVESVVNGAPLAVPGIAMFTPDITRGARVAMLTLKGELVGLGEALMDSKEIEASEKGLAVRPRTVVMERGIYPRAWKSRSQT